MRDDYIHFKDYNLVKLLIMQQKRAACKQQFVANKIIALKNNKVNFSNVNFSKCYLKYICICRIN